MGEGSLKDDWTAIRLGDVARIRHGYAFEGANFSDAPTTDVLVTPGNFSIGGGFKLDKLKYYDGPVASEYVLKEGDLVVTMTDLSKLADTLGYSALVPKTNLRFLHNQRIGKVEVISDVTSSAFLHWVMRTDEYRHEIVASATGSTVKHTAPSRIEAYRFRLPPLPEQRAIAHILGTLDDKIELNRRTNETLEAMARALFKSWFVDFDPVHAKKAGRKPEGMDAETAALFPDDFEDSEMGKIPRGWKAVPLDTIADFLNGLALQKFPAAPGEPSLPVIKIAQLRKGAVDGADRASRSVPMQYVVKDGDLLFSWSGTLEVAVWCGGEGALNQHLFKVTSKTTPPWFYHGWLLHHLADFRQIAADTLCANVT